MKQYINDCACAIMILEKIFKHPKCDKMTKGANPIMPYFFLGGGGGGFCPVALIFYFHFMSHVGVPDQLEKFSVTPFRCESLCFANILAKKLFCRKNCDHGAKDDDDRGIVEKILL